MLHLFVYITILILFLGLNRLKIILMPIAPSGTTQNGLWWDIGLLKVAS